MDGSKEVRELLARIREGDGVATETLFPVLYNELHALAGRHFRGGRQEHTLQPTVLVHEVFLKLAGSAPCQWEGRAHFCAVAAKAMRQILANHAEAKRTAKRGGGQHRVTLSGLAGSEDTDSRLDLIDLDDALARLAESSPRKARIVELRFLAGLNEKETASVLGLSTSTVQREWRMARAFLKCELSGDGFS